MNTITYFARAGNLPQKFIHTDRRGDLFLVTEAGPGSYGFGAFDRRKRGSSSSFASVVPSVPQVKVPNVYSEWAEGEKENGREAKKQRRKERKNEIWEPELELQRGGGGRGRGSTKIDRQTDRL